MTLDEQLVDLLLRADDLRQRGTPVTPEELCRDCSQLLPELKQLLCGLGAVERLMPVPDPGPAGVASPAPRRAAPTGYGNPERHGDLQRPLLPGNVSSATVHEARVTNVCGSER